jgi:hypothetical protein
MNDPPRPNPIPESRVVPLDTVHLDPDDTLEYSARYLEVIRASLMAFGQVEPLVVDRATGRVIGANGRLAVMREMGLTECRVVYSDGAPSRADHPPGDGAHAATGSEDANDDGPCPVDADGGPGPDADDVASAEWPGFFPLPIMLTRAQLRAWEQYKVRVGVRDDTKAFLEAVEL